MYNCGAGDVTVNLAAGVSTTVGPFAAGTSLHRQRADPAERPGRLDFRHPVDLRQPGDDRTKGDQAAAVRGDA